MQTQGTLRISTFKSQCRIILINLKFLNSQVLINSKAFYNKDFNKIMAAFVELTKMFALVLMAGDFDGRLYRNQELNLLKFK